jgi:hypothetical protein
MTFEANVKHGLPTSHEERLHQAVWLINNGTSQDAAAALVNIKASDIKRAWARVQADQRADEVGILRTQWDPIAQSSKSRLAGVITDEGMKAAANLVFRAAMTPDEVFEMVQQLNAVKSSGRQVAIVKGVEEVFKDRIQESGAGLVTGSRRARTPKQTFNMVLGQVNTLPENPLSIASRFVGDERGEAAKRARKASDQLIAIADALEAATS